MSTRLRSRSRSSERSQSTLSRSTRRSSDSESQKTRSTSRSLSRSSSRSDSRSGSVSGSERSTSTLSDEGSTDRRTVITSASSKASSARSSFSKSSASTVKKTSVVNEDVRTEGEKDKKWSDPLHSPYNPGGAVRWRKREPSFKPRYPQNGLNASKIEGVRRDTFDYYIHRRKIAEVKSMVDNRPPQIYPHVYYDMKKLRKRQEEQAMIQRNNHRLLSKLVVAMTTTRIDNVPQNRDSYMRNKQSDHRRVERLMESSSRTSNLPRFAN